MSCPKWLPKDLQHSYHLFDDLNSASVTFKCLTNRYLNEINFNVPDLYVVRELTKLTVNAFRKSNDLQIRVTKAYVKQPGDKRIDRNPYNQLVSQKAAVILGNLQQKQCQLIFIMRKQINVLLQAAMNHDGFVDDALVLVAIHNKCVEFTSKFNFGGAAQICCVSYTTISLPPSRIDVKDILQSITVRRSEHCCLQLISSLLVSCQTDTGSESESETSSIEVLKALTSHMSSGASPLEGETQPSASADPTMAFFDKMVSAPHSTDDNLKTDANIDHLEKMISTEENYFAFILLKCLQLCPSIFETQPTQADIIKRVNKATQSLWTQTGATLEHVVLWWCSTPLACQPVAAARHLRDWLLNMQYDEAPGTLVSILKCLGETMTVHVACTTWDKQFRLALVASSLPIDYKFESQEFYLKKNRQEGTTTTGRLWSELLYTLTTFCNNCDQHSTIPNELPIVEQIAVLHRLDHSIHTMRLWAAAKSKALCIDWCMEMFFKVVHNDINQCLEQIKVLRTPDLVPPDPLEVEIQVNVALRAKLISEVKVNICKLKLTSSECIEVLAAICKMLSLATLSLCFPKSQFWQSNLLQESANDYVNRFLGEVYLPVVQATDVLEILNLILRIMCEAWLDHIYSQKIKFSREGALNLLRDFEGVSDWIIACNYVQPEHVDILSKHEVLRTCEGVGKILLRKPFEIISMIEPTPYTPRVQQKPNDPEGETLLPPEMFVPNQKRWLELRARNRNRLNSIMCICAGQSCMNNNL